MTEISIREAYEILGGTWVRIADIQSITGQTPAEIEKEVQELRKDESFRAEADPMPSRITEHDRRFGPKIGGEQVHMIRFE